MLGTPSSNDYGLQATISTTQRSEVGLGVRNTGYAGYLLDVNFNTGYFNMIKVTGGVGATYDRKSRGLLRPALAT